MAAVTEEPDFRLDITGDVCPMTFVKAKLLIERMSPGQVCEIRLRGVEPLVNVPRSVTDLGHRVTGLVREEGEPDDGIHRLRIVRG
ncbi:MAG: sulfurtransferase TusA family protein [Alphaproteobacteria bacterium]